MNKLNSKQQLLLLARFGFRRSSTSLFSDRLFSKTLSEDEEFLLNDLGFSTTRDGVKVYVTVSCHD